MGVDSAHQLEPLSENVLISRLAGGDARAAKSLVERHQKFVFSLVWRMLSPKGRGHLAEDIAQETFLRAFRAIDTFDQSRGTKFSTWLATIATRLTIDELRKKRPENAAVGSAEEITDKRTFDSCPQESMRSADIRKAIESAVAKLSDTNRVVFILRDTQGLTYDEIAQVLDIDIGTVKSRLSRARQALRQRLKGIRHER